MSSRYATGGLEERFIVIRRDGKAISEDRRYLVLDIGGSDPHALVAMHAYANSVLTENPQLSADLIAALADPTKAPKQHL